MLDRLDIYLVNNHFVSTRSKAQQLIRSGNVLCNGQPITKNGYSVTETDIITVNSFDVLKYVSRGGLKLEKAVCAFCLDFNDRTVLDIGSSTGGFTDCALQHGARKVIAVDVGKNIMEKALANDPRVELHEETDIRDLSSQLLKIAEIVVCDVSFISIKQIIPNLLKCNHDAQFVFLIKPQFECGKDIARKYKGVIKNPDIHRVVLKDVISFIQDNGFSLRGITNSPIQGGDGNIEYITHFQFGKRIETDLDLIVNEAFRSFL